MVDGLIGKKVGMTQAFDAAGNAVPLTVIKAGPCTVIQRKTKAKDGYDALQMGLVEERPVRKPGKAQQGHFLKSGSPVLRVLREFPVKGEAKEGDQVFVDIFEAGQKVARHRRQQGQGLPGCRQAPPFQGRRRGPRLDVPPGPRLDRRLLLPLPGHPGPADGRADGRRHRHRPQPAGLRGRPGATTS